MSDHAYIDGNGKWRVMVSPRRGRDTITIHKETDEPELGCYDGQFEISVNEIWQPAVELTMLRGEVEELRDALTDLLEKTKDQPVQRPVEQPQPIGEHECVRLISPYVLGTE